MTIAAWNYVIHQMSFKPPFYATLIIKHFLNSMISAIPDKVEGHSANDEIFIKGFETLNYDFIKSL